MTLQGAIIVCYGWGECRCWVPLQGVREEGDDQLWGSGRGAIAGCHYSVLWLGGVQLQGAIAMCHCSVPLQGARGEGEDQLWGEWTLSAILGCHCSVLWLGAFFLYIDNTK